MAAAAWLNTADTDKPLHIGDANPTDKDLKKIIPWVRYKFQSHALEALKQKELQTLQWNSKTEPLNVFVERFNHLLRDAGYGGQTHQCPEGLKIEWFLKALPWKLEESVRTTMTTQLEMAKELAPLWGHTGAAAQFTEKLHMAQELAVKNQTAHELRVSRIDSDKPRSTRSEGSHRGENRRRSDNSRDNHNRSDNNRETRTCHNCGKVGHIAKDCRSPKRDNNNDRNRNGRNNNGNNNRDPWCNDCRTRHPDGKHTRQQQASSNYAEIVPALIAEVTEETTTNEPARRRSTKPTLPKLTVTVNGQEVTLSIDTGSSLSIISHDCVKRLGLEIQEPSPFNIASVHGASVVPLGIIRDIPVEIMGIKTPITAVVLEKVGRYEFLAGWEYLKTYRAHIDARNMQLIVRVGVDTTAASLEDGEGLLPDETEDQETEENPLIEMPAFYACAVDLEPSNVAVWTDPSADPLLFHNPWTDVPVSTSKGDPAAQETDPAEESADPEAASQDPEELALDPPEQDTAITFVPVFSCYEAYRYADFARQKDPINKGFTYTVPHLCGSSYWGDSEHKTGRICDDCSVVRTLQRRFQKCGAVYICGQCGWCENTPRIPDGVMSWTVPVHDAAEAFRNVTTTQDPVEATPRKREMQEDGEMQEEEESDVEIILPEPMNEQPKIQPPIRLPVIRPTRPGQKKCRNTFLHKGCGEWKPTEQFLDGSKHCDDCRYKDIEEREQRKCSADIHCYVCGKCVSRAVARTNGLKPREYFCSEECARVLNVQNYHSKRKVSWQKAKERVLAKSACMLDRDEFFRKCDDVKEGRLKPGTFQEFIDWTQADDDIGENPSEHDPDDPAKYDTWWAELQLLTASEENPPILAEQWNDPDKFDVAGTTMSDYFNGCVDPDF